MTYESYMAESEYLQHHGVLGMKWGVRRYQPYPDNYRGDGKFLGKRERQLSRTQDRIERSVAKARKAAEKGDVKALNKYNKRTARLTKKEQKQIKRVDKARARYEKNAEINAQMEAKEKERLLSKGSTQELVESLGKYDYSDAELNRAYNRINAETKLSSLMDAEKNAKFDKGAETISKITNLGKKALDGYDTYTKIADVVNKATGKDTLPIPGAKAKREKEKKLNEIIRSVDYDKIMENRSKLTPEEFSTAMKSITTAAGAKKSYGEALSKYAEGKKAERDLKETEKEWAKEDKKEALSKVKAEAAREAAASALAREKAAKERADKGVPDYKSVVAALGGLSIAKASETYDYDKRKTEGLIDRTKVRYIPESFIKEDPDGYFVYDYKKRKEDGEVKHSDISGDFLQHHGVQGQKWGVRRYQNPDGSLTAEGRKRYKSIVGRGKTYVEKGQPLYRAQTTTEHEGKTRAKLYVTTDKTEAAKYATRVIGPGNLAKTGKLIAAEYAATKILDIPSEKVQRKMEVAALKNKEARQDVIDALINKGVSNKEAINWTDPKLPVKTDVITWVTAIGTLPLNVVAPTVAPAIVLAGERTKQRQLSYLRATQGDERAKNYNKEFNRLLTSKGYEGYRDLNDKKKNIAKTPLVIINPDKNVELTSAEKVDKKKFGELYKESRKLEVKKKERDFISDAEREKGEKIYEAQINAYADSIINEKKNKEREAERKKVLEKAGAA